MGFFDDVMRLTAAPAESATGHVALVDGLMQLLGSGESGLDVAGVVERFTEIGLGDQVSSWVGSGVNLPISTAQLRRGLGTDRVRQLAESAGLSEAAAARALSDLLPAVVDKLTPEGALPQPEQLPALMALAVQSLSPAHQDAASDSRKIQRSIGTIPR